MKTFFVVIASIAVLIAAVIFVFVAKDLKREKRGTG